MRRADSLRRFDCWFEQTDIKKRAPQKLDDICHVSSGRCSFQILEEDCKRSEQHFGSTSVTCRCGGKRVGRCGETRTGIVLCSSDLQYKESVRIKCKFSVRNLNRKKMSAREREKNREKEYCRDRRIELAK